MVELPGKRWGSGGERRGRTCDVTAALGGRRAPVFRREQQLVKFRLSLKVNRQTLPGRPDTYISAAKSACSGNPAASLAARPKVVVYGGETEAGSTAFETSKTKSYDESRRKHQGS